MAGTETKRIIELTEASTVQSGDFIAVDSNARGTKKVPTSALATSAALTAETNARAGADEQMSERMDGIEEQTALIQNPTKTLSGALCSFTDGADMPMVACRAEIVPKQAGSGTPSPDNVRQISGWESVNVNVTGVNLWDEEWELGGISPSTGANVTDNTTIRSKNYIKVSPNTTYYLKSGSGGTFNYRLYDENKAYISGTYIGANNTLTMPSGASYLRFVIGSAYGTTYKNDISINYPSTDHEYHAYNPNSHTTTNPLGRTVYGGTLDVVSGVLTATHVLIDLGSLTWLTYNDKFDCVELPFEPLRKATGTPCPMVCSIYKAGTFGNSAPQGDKTIWLSDSESWVTLWVEDEDYTTPAEFKTAMSGVQLCYELATPQTYTLTGQEVSTLLGDNNVWVDSGDVEITYRRDISIVLENLENALNGSNSLNTMMMSAPTENTAEEPTEDEAEDDMR